MATNDRVTRLRLRFETSAQDVQRAKSAVQGLLQQVDALENQQRQLDAQYARSIQVQMENARALNNNSSFVSNLRSDLATLANEQENVNRAQATTNRTTNESIDLLGRYRRAVEGATTAEQKRVGSVGAGTAGRLGQVDRFGRVGGQILGGLGANEAANAVNLVGDVADSFTLLSPPMLAVTVASVGIGLVLNDIARKAEEAKEAGQRYLATQVEINRLLAGGATRDVLVERFREQQVELDAYSAALTTTVEALQEVQQQFDDNIISYDEWSRETDRLRAAFDAGVRETERLRGEMQLTTDAMNSQTLTQNELAAAIEATRVAAFEASNAAKDLSIKQAEQARTAQEAAQALANANSEKTKEIQLAREAAAAASEAIRAQGITDVTNELFEAQTAVVDASNRQREAQEALAEAQGKVTDTIRELEASAEQERTANLRDAGEERAKVARDSEERILDITRKGALSVLNAIGARDALAAHQAAEQAKEQINDEKDSARKRQRDLDESLQKQNRTVDERLRERIRLEQVRGTEEINTKRRLLEQVQVDLRNAQNAELLTRRQANIILGQEAFKGGQSMVAFFKAGVEQALRQGGGSKGGGFGGKAQTSYFHTAPQFSGSFAPAPNTPFQFTTPQGGGGMTFAPQVQGATIPVLRKELHQYTEEFLSLYSGRRRATA